ncbi:hypothetical protein N2152v2_007757 [Parachlorella kessleri]
MPASHLSSFANINACCVEHCDLHLRVDFESQTLAGQAKYIVVIKRAGVSVLVLDTRDITVGCGIVNGEAAQLSLGEPHKVLGAPLHIKLPASLAAGETVVVELDFVTSPQSSAVQFLEPSQTAGGKHPFLFTQCQSIQARSLIPCQDIPAAKMSYTAAVTVPRGLRALMSALQCEQGEGPEGLSPPANPDGNASPPSETFYFRQPVPIATYLLALVVGDLESRPLGPISRVWAEPSMVDAAAWEFAETPRFLEAAEKVAGIPYVWGRYDLLLLPPSFPYGGMENPCLTFVTPTLLAGDRSLANVVAHEIAHSWTGNLASVTCASWEDEWLNEGWTMWLERKIIGRLYGEQMYQFHAVMGLRELRAVVDDLGPTHPFTCLCPKIPDDVDPDDVSSSICYEKGFYFIQYLQELVGGSAVFEDFFRDYLRHYQGKSLSSDDFRCFVTSYFEGKVPAVATIDWQTWYHTPGMPPLVNKYDQSLAKQADALAAKWHSLDADSRSDNRPQGCSPDDLKGWVVAFLDALRELCTKQALHASTARKMAALYGLDSTRNSEIRFSWYQLCLKAGDEAVLPQVQAFLKQQGRIKYLEPLYKELIAFGGPGRELARKTFDMKKQEYHPVASRMVGEELKREP